MTNDTISTSHKTEMMMNQNNDIELDINNKYEILKKLLRNKFDNKLLLLENNTENQMHSIYEGIKTSNQIVSTCINLTWIIKPKLEEKRNNSINKINKISSISPAKITLGRTNSIRPNTPFKKNRISVSRLTTETSINRKSNNNSRKNEISPFTLKKNTENKRNISKKKNKVSNLDSSFIRINNKRLTINNNVKALKNSKTQVNILRDSQRKKSINVIHHQKVNSININRSKNGINLDLNDDLLKESDLFKNNDPILIAPISDLDFIPKGLLTDIYDINSSKLYHVTKFNVSEFIETNLNDIIKFLDITDLTNIVLVNHAFRNCVYSQILSNLENERKNYLDFVSSVSNDEIIPKYTKDNIQLSKGAIKAIRLLNESILNKLFTEDENLSDDNILLIYHIYFQLINHPLSKVKLDKMNFWKKCCYYFTHEENGKIGDLLEKNYKENLDLSTENLYRIIHIIKGNLSKISPSYYSRICGTTGLFVFFIKDILDYFGISNDKKTKPKAYWTYKDLIELLDKRIEVIRKYLVK